MTRRATLVVAAALVLLPAAADATTGPGYLLRPPAHTVPSAVAKRFPGQYVMRSVGKDSRIRSSALFIEFGQEGGFLVGGAQFYGYDSAGQQSSWVGTLYDFQEVGPVMHINIVGPGGTPVLGTLTVRRGHGGGLSGTITTSDGTFPIAYRRLPGAAPPPQQVVVAPPAAKPKPGWGPQADWVGRYRSVVPTGGGGFLSTIVDWAQSLVTGSEELTAFMRTVRKGQPLVPSAILSVHTSSETDVYYLTNLRYAADRRTASVNGGSFDGPVLGRFTGTVSNTAMKGVLVLSGGEKRIFRLNRFSTNPHP